MITYAEEASQLAIMSGPAEIAWTKSNMLALVAVMVEEGSPARCNPFDTTWPMPGSTDLPGNPDHVKEYVSVASGNLAVLFTLKQPTPAYGYGAILAALKSGECGCQVVEAWANSSWGTWFHRPDLAVKTLLQVQANWPAYSTRLVHGS